MKVVVDLDGTICTLKKNGESYNDVIPLPGAIETLNWLHREGHKIIIYTARNMRTCDGNVGRVIKNVGKITIDWLEKYNIPYDEIVFGKPDGDIYIDDKGFQFMNWEHVTKHLNSTNKVT
ncbi:MAG: capsular biosynthesis protein [Bacillota bacterium]